MESGNGVPVEEEKMVESEKVANANEEKTGETPNLCSVKTELSGNVGKSKASSQRKLVSTKNDKPAKDDQASKRGTTALTRTKRASISQSLSFPARGVGSNVMRKSIDVYPKKSDTSLSKGSSVSSLNSDKSAGVLKNANTNGGVATSRRTTIAAGPTLHQSMSGKPLSANGSAKAATSQVSNDENQKPTKVPLSLKGDDDARSTTSASATPRGQRRASIAGFSFRLEERAEKRKEFLAKIEEKIQAKETEKINLQAKSKENHEAEIKQLRKILTFKATPMPSFYKEPPPKAELKKLGQRSYRRLDSTLEDSTLLSWSAFSCLSQAAFRMEEAAFQISILYMMGRFEKSYKLLGPTHISSTKAKTKLELQTENIHKSNSLHSHICSFSLRETTAYCRLLGAEEELFLRHFCSSIGQQLHCIQARSCWWTDFATGAAI